LLNRIRAEASSIRDGFSRFIHSKIQGRLALVSFILGQIASGEIKGREKTKQVKRLTELLDTIEEELKALSPQAPRQSLPELAAQLEAEWAGLLEVLFEVEPAATSALSDDAVLENQVASIIEEALLNSRLHGKATEVSIRVAKSAGADSRIKVSVIDNGVGLAKDRTSGLGSSYFSAVCESWTLKRIDSNTRFDALIQGAAA
jgi:signal transduction histidine kinase